MNLSAQEITQQLLLLPVDEQQEALDFIEFLRIKSARKKLQKLKSETLKQEGQTNVSTEGEKMMHIMEEFGLLGCMSGDGKLSEDYKKHLWGNP